MESNKNEMDRRDFLKALGAGAVASTATLAGCNPKSADKTVAGRTNEMPAGEMTYRTQPRTGDRVSLLGYGCMRWATRQKADGSGDEINQDFVNELVDYAIEHGVNYFDTSPSYVRGWSETATGIALKRHPRDKFFIATKMSNFGDTSRQTAISLYNNSMKALQVDYLDYYLLHGAGLGDGMNSFRQRFIDNGVLDFLLEERQAGRIRNLGWSFHGDVKVFDHLVAMDDIGWDFAQIQLNFADWLYAEGWNVKAEYLYGELTKHSIPAVVMEPLLGGRLSRLNTLALELLKQLRPEDNPATWAFRFAGSHDNVLTVLSGMTYMEHLQDNVRTYSPLDPLTDAERETLAKVADMIFNAGFIKCTECQYCMPCPYGLNIPAVFAHYNRCINDGNMPKEAGDPEYRRQRRAFLLGYDRNVPKLRQASHCTNCGQCSPKCTQRINIPAEMVRIDKFVEELKINQTVI